MKRSVAALLIAAVMTISAAPACAAVEGTVITAKAGVHPLILWDCTPAIVEIVNGKKPRDAALRDLESQAMRLAGERIASLTGAQTITVRVVYQKTGDVSPTYGTPTFEGVERVFDLTVDARAAKSQSDVFARSLANGTTPKGVTLTVSGALPPP